METDKEDCEFASEGESDEEESDDLKLTCASPCSVCFPFFAAPWPTIPSHSMYRRYVLARTAFV